MHMYNTSGGPGVGRRLPRADVSPAKKSMPAFKDRAKIIDFMKDKSFEDMYPIKHIQPMYLKSKPFVLKWQEEKDKQLGRKTMLDDLMK